MKIIIGLGNIGKEYEKTRHNIGFIVVDKIASILEAPEFSFSKKFEGEISETSFNENKILLVKPSTYMNRSGETVRKILDFYKEKPENIIVIHDELDLILGNFKICFSRNSAGHKGVQSIIDHLKTKDFTRIRIGIEIEERKTPTEKFVLQNFSKEELDSVEKIIEKIITKTKEELL